jgi:hypothetical protein
LSGACGVEISTRITKDIVITVAIDLSTAFTSLRAVNLVQDDVPCFQTNKGFTKEKAVSKMKRLQI